MKKLFAAIIALGASLMMNAQNPYLPLWEHLPDGEPRVFEDPDNPGKLRAYIIGSHDVSMDRYCGPDVRMWSAPVDDLTKWRCEGSIFTYHIDGQWDTMFAPDLIEVKDKDTGKKTYYLYPHCRGEGRLPMVCKSDRPDGPFTPINMTPDGHYVVDGSIIGFDPSVFIENITDKNDKDYDKGFRAYAFYGFEQSTALEVDQNTMYSLRPGTKIHDHFLPAFSRYGQVSDPPGTEYPALYKGQNPGEFNFFEASSIRQIGNKYVMVFSGYSGPEYGVGTTNSALRYAYGDSPLGPWRSGGVLVDSRGIVPNEKGTELTITNFNHNTHGSLQEINGQWYVFFHRPPRCFGYARQAMVAPVKIVWDKKPVAEGGRVKITGYDAFAKDNEWTAKTSEGWQYKGAEITSEGFQIFGLPPYRYYPAGIACYINDNNAMLDNHDVWNNAQDIAGLENGDIVGYKYFGFGGLAKTTKGVIPFAAAVAGNKTTFHLTITPRTENAFKIRVMLDGPYANSTWNGKEIAVIDVAGNQNGKQIEVSAPVPAVEGLKGKHAIYLKIDGPEVDRPQQEWGEIRHQDVTPQGLLDLHGLGFSSKDCALVKPVVPTVEITVDGDRCTIPDTPIYSTNYNGYTDCNHYQTYAKMNDNSVIKVTPSDPSITYTIGKIADGRASVKCTWNGVSKVFLIN